MKKLLTLLAVLLLGAPLLGQAQSANGEPFGRIVPAVPTQSGDKIEVVELFWYGCPHCYRLEPYMERWLKKKPDDVEFIRIPAILPRSWELMARAYYTAEALNILDEVHQPIFDALHMQRRRITTEDQLADLFAEHGVDKDKFHKTFRSFSVDSKTRRAGQLTRKYGIDGVPAIIVNGKYRTGGSLAGSNTNLIRVIDQLIERERQAKN